ncbi:hypothetical protein [Photobacterium angustum]|uniref:hypothetical protein n=1 Tax=Photobacterium angustum TaxID=661 RepID=UPI00069B6685|nr:hypothetical protein [Photobacterium angustum]PSV61675.1 bacteriocin [Photobacterium angustum]
MGRNDLEQTTKMAGQAVQTEAANNKMEQDRKTAEKNEQMSMVGAGAAMGMSFGPVGAVVGAAAGYLASELF